jgi:hypothetical protein
MVNQSYLTSNDTTEIIKNIKLIYKKIMVSGTCCKYSNNPSLNKLIKKEATYLKIIIKCKKKPAYVNIGRFCKLFKN